jgi:hypothetical protein
VIQKIEKEPAKAALFTANYKEQLTWRDAATGKIIAASDFFEPLSINGLIPPGFGGRVYSPSAVGKGFYLLQVTPKPEPDRGSRWRWPKDTGVEPPSRDRQQCQRLGSWSAVPRFQRGRDWGLVTRKSRIGSGRDATIPLIDRRRHECNTMDRNG